MRLTVGPLPAAVYWRRRAVVVGAILLFLIVVMYSCTGPGESGLAAQPGTSAEPPPQQTPTVLTPETGAPPSSEPPATASAEPSKDGAGCTDAEVSVVPVPSQKSARPGVTIDLRLRIKNVAKRTCTRDVGALAQEIYIKVGAQKVWSSDTCSTARDSNVQSLQPGIELEYRVSWNGRDSSKCAGGFASGPHPEPGEYQIFGRLGTKISDPVAFTITD